MIDPAQGSEHDRTAVYTAGLDARLAPVVRPAYTSAMAKRHDDSVVFDFSPGGGWAVVVRLVNRAGVPVVAELAIMPSAELDRRQDAPEGSRSDPGYYGTAPTDPPPGFELWAARLRGMLIRADEVPESGITGRLLRSLGIGEIRTGLPRAAGERDWSSPLVRSLVPAPKGAGSKSKRAARSVDDFALAALGWLDLSTRPGVGPRRALKQYVTDAVASGSCPNTKPAKQRAYERFKRDLIDARKAGLAPSAPRPAVPPQPSITPALRAWCEANGHTEELAQIERRMIAPPQLRGRTGKEHTP